MLNTKKGPAVQAPRAQADKDAYRADNEHGFRKTPNLEIKQGNLRRAHRRKWRNQGHYHKRRA